MSGSVTFTSWRDRAPLDLLGHLFSDTVTIKILYEVNILYHQAALYSVSHAILMGRSTFYFARSKNGKAYFKVCLTNLQHREVMG